MTAPTITAPCVGLCGHNLSAQYCFGGGRDLDAIAHWDVLSDDEKAKALEKAKARLENEE